MDKYAKVINEIERQALEIADKMAVLGSLVECFAYSAYCQKDNIERIQALELLTILAECERVFHKLDKEILNIKYVED